MASGVAQVARLDRAAEILQTGQLYAHNPLPVV